MKNRSHTAERLLTGSGMILALAVLVFALTQVARCLRDKDAREQIHARLAQTAVTAVPPAPQVSEAPSAEETVIAPPLPQIPITVDFAPLLAQNADVAAWIYCPDTPINYPVVQGEDNQYYLDHMIDGSINPGGTIFLDYRCAASLEDGYSVIYGHNLKDQALFGSLLNYADPAYYDAHPVMFVLTPEKNFVLELFAGFVTEDGDGLYYLPPTALTKEKLIKNCMERSDFDSPLRPTAEDRLVILSTCAYDFEDARYVLAGVLREN